MTGCSTGSATPTSCSASTWPRSRQATSGSGPGLPSPRPTGCASRSTAAEPMARVRRPGAPRDPVIETTHSFGAVVNDEEAADRISAAFAGRFGADRVFDPGPVTGSEDVGLFATAAGVPCVYWLLGGADPGLF